MPETFLPADQQKYVLYGPPASGKSTLIRLLPTLGYHIAAVDLELTDNERREETINYLRGLRCKGPLFVGAADLDFPQFKGFKVILLLTLDKAHYLANFDARSKEQPEKADQTHEEYYGDFMQNWSHQLDKAIHIDPQGSTPIETAKEILRRIQGQD